MKDQQVQQRLMEAAEAGDISLLYECIQDNPKILDSIDETPFVDTPLHIAASAGHAHFALEMMRLMPSFGKKLNPQGLSPLDLALQRRERLSPSDLALQRRERLSPSDQDLRNRITSTISRLINFDKKLIRVKGRESFTPLHYVAEKGDCDLLAEFLLTCPESIMDRTIRDETALHIAVKNSKLEACEVLLGWLRRTLNKKLLNSKDEKGNTVLHIAVSNSQTEIVKLLAEESNTNKNEKNLDGFTALGIAAGLEPDGVKTDIEGILRRAGALERSSSPTRYSRADFLKSPERWIEKIIKYLVFLEIFLNPNFFSMSEETRNTVLVVSVLVATSAYQAVLSPPGGVRGLGGDNNNQLTTNANATLINATIISTTGLATNVSHFNGTIFTPTATNTNYNPANQVLYHDPLIKKDITYGSFFTIFYFVNTLCFFSSIFTIVAVLPVQFLSVVLYATTLFLMVSYGISFYVISPSYSNTSYFTIASTLFSCLIPYPIMIGVFLTQWYKSLSRLHRKRFEMLKLCLKRRSQKSD